MEWEGVRTDRIGEKLSVTYRIVSCRSVSYRSVAYHQRPERHEARALNSTRRCAARRGAERRGAAHILVAAQRRASLPFTSDHIHGIPRVESPHVAQTLCDCTYCVLYCTVVLCCAVLCVFCEKAYAVFLLHCTARLHVQNVKCMRCNAVLYIRELLTRHCERFVSCHSFIQTESELCAREVHNRAMRRDQHVATFCFCILFAFASHRIRLYCTALLVRVLCPVLSPLLSSHSLTRTHVHTVRRPTPAAPATTPGASGARLANNKLFP